MSQISHKFIPLFREKESTKVRSPLTFPPIQILQFVFLSYDVLNLGLFFLPTQIHKRLWSTCLGAGRGTQVCQAQSWPQGGVGVRLGRKGARRDEGGILELPER